MDHGQLRHQVKKTRNALLNQGLIIKKRAQRALGRSPEEKVKGHRGV